MASRLFPSCPVVLGRARRFGRRRLSALAGGLLFVASALLPASSWAQDKVVAWNIHPDGYPVTEALKSFVSEVATVTGGKYRIELNNNGALGDQPKAVQMFKDGSIDVAEFNAGPLSAAAPGLNAFNLPFLFTDSAHMFRHLDGAVGDRLSAKLKDAGFVVLGWYDGGARSFFCANKPMARPQDFSGHRIRVQQSDVYIDMVKLLGATPVVLPYKDILDGLTQKKIDCAEGNLVSYESTGQYKVAKYMYLDNHIVSPEALVVSTRLWNRLDDREKAAFKKAGMNSAVLMRHLWNLRVAAARDTVLAGGAQFTPMTDAAALVHRMTPLYAKYMADPDVRGELLSIVGQ